MTIKARECPQQIKAVKELNKLVPSEKQEATFGLLIRQAIEEVIDGPRSGRIHYQELSKTEKAYIGTKIEIMIADLLKANPGQTCDLSLDGIEVDVKTSATTCMFPKEAVGQVCLLVLHNSERCTFSVGVWHCNEAGLNKGSNRDGKRTISKSGKQEVTWLINAGRLPESFFHGISSQWKKKLFGKFCFEQKVDALAEWAVNNERLLPRDAFETVGLELEEVYQCLAANNSCIGKWRFISPTQAEANRHEHNLPKVPKRHWLILPLD